MPEYPDPAALTDTLATRYWMTTVPVAVVPGLELNVTVGADVYPLPALTTATATTAPFSSMLTRRSAPLPPPPLTVAVGGEV
jgi:hypothetical protein